MKFDDRSLQASLDAISTSAGTLHRPAAQAAADVLYTEVLQRVPVSKRVRQVRGKTIRPGKLKASIYQVFSKDNSDELHSTYHVSWNAKKAPHGHLVEYGTSRAPAHPFIRPSYDAKKKAALRAARDRFVQDMGVELQRIRK